MTYDPLTELRASRPRPDENWATSTAGQQVMHRALVRDAGMADSRQRRGVRPSRSTLAIVVGAVLIGGAAAQAVGVPGLNDEPSKKSIIANSETPLFPADDGPAPDAVQSELAKRVTQLLTPADESARDADGVPPQLAYGIVGFTGSPTDGYTVVIGKGEDPEVVRGLVLEGVSSESARYLTTQSADHTTAELERIWRAVVAYQRSTGAGSYSLDVDPGSGRIEVTVGPTYPEQRRAGLRRLGGDALEIRQAAAVIREPAQVPKSSW